MNNTNPTVTTPPILLPIHSIGQALMALLKSPARLIQALHADKSAKLPVGLGLFGLAALACYGLIVGSFSGGHQVWIAALKISLGTLTSFAICLPSLFIFACLSGAEVSVRSVLGILSAILALTALLLVGFVPVAWVFSQSTDSLAFVGALHLLFWLVAMGFALRLLERLLETLQIRDWRHIKLWMVMLILVSLQMSTALRPLLGKSDSPFPKDKKFFITHWAEHVFNSVP
jgi:hypothetical protein